MDPTVCQMLLKELEEFHQNSTAVEEWMDGDRLQLDDAMWLKLHVYTIVMFLIAFKVVVLFELIEQMNMKQLFKIHLILYQIPPDIARLM